MNFELLNQVLALLKEYEQLNANHRQQDIHDFKKWITATHLKESVNLEPDWEFKSTGRSAESVINTLIVHLNRYAKTYSKSAIDGSAFATQEDFIFLISLRAFGEMTKMELIKKNVHEKSVGMLIINRLIDKEWIIQTDSSIDKRSKLIQISEKGIEALDGQMDKIRLASKIVVGNLTEQEKMLLIELLTKLDHFHKPIYEKNFEPQHLLNQAYNSLQ